MKIVNIILTLAAVVGLAAGACAQDLAATTGTVDIPYAFVVNGKLLPAGTYTLQTEAGNPAVLHLVSADPHGQFVKLLLRSNAAADPAHMKLVFEQNGSEHVLTKVETPAGSALF